MSASSAVHSNAFNFQRHVQRGVDPRTGLYTVSLALPALKCNALAGPVLPLTLAFSPVTLTDIGLGQGWRLNLSEYDPGTRVLSLGTGERYRVTGSGATPAIAEKKLDTFHFHDDGNGTYRIVHKGGHIEVLKVMGSADQRLAMPIQLLDRAGRRVSLSYTAFDGGERLASIADASGERLRVVRNDNRQVVLQFPPGSATDGKAPASVVLQLDAQCRVTEVTLPTQERASWRIAYAVIRGITSVTDLWTPGGAHETLAYDDAGHPFPAGAHPALPRVTQHRVDPGAGQPVTEVQHAYTRGNFLGYGALDSWDDSGRDNVYDIVDLDFTYGSTATWVSDGKVQRSVKRTFNRFHLLVEEETTEGTCRKWVSTTPYAELPESLGKPFALQPPQCQLTFRTTTRWELTDDPTQRGEDSEATLYDVHGNLLERIPADGTILVNSYYPAEGEGQDCPPDPQGFVRSLRTTILYPAHPADGDTPILGTRFFYTLLMPIPGPHSQPFIRECRQVQSRHLADGGTEELRTVETEYYTDTGNAHQIGRVACIKETFNGTTRTTRY